MFVPRIFDTQRVDSVSAFLTMTTRHRMEQFLETRHDNARTNAEQATSLSAMARDRLRKCAFRLRNCLIFRLPSARCRLEDSTTSGNKRRAPSPLANDNQFIRNDFSTAGNGREIACKAARV